MSTSAVLLLSSEAANPQAAESRRRLRKLLGSASPSVRQALSSFCRAFEKPTQEQGQLGDFSWLVSQVQHLKPEKIYTIRVILDDYDTNPTEEALANVVTATAEVVCRSAYDAEAIAPTSVEPSAELEKAEAGLRKHRDYVGEKIRMFREKRGLNQTQLALVVGFDQSTISRIENGLHPNTHLTIRKIAKALRVKAGEIDPTFA
jgi:DNA-binding XRE family transcriptional regulator